MTVLKVVFVALLCVPLLYVSYVLVGKLMDEYIKDLKGKK
jgi:hypothetical protein